MLIRLLSGTIGLCARMDKRWDWLAFLHIKPLLGRLFESCKETEEYVMSDSETVRGRPFEPGQSGNPKGRPKGSRNAVTLLAESLLDGEAEAIIRKLVQEALDGNPSAMRLALERMLPPKRHRTTSIEFEGEINTPADAARASAAVLSACAKGEIAAEEATQIMSVIGTHVKLVESADLAARIAALENLVQK